MELLSYTFRVELDETRDIDRQIEIAGKMPGWLSSEFVWGCAQAPDCVIVEIDAGTVDRLGVGRYIAQHSPNLSRARRAAPDGISRAESRAIQAVHDRYEYQFYRGHE